jgi:L-Ala-D/L-Glu epimerase
MNAHIVAVAAFRREFKLRNPSVVAYEATETAPNVIVRLQTADGRVGWGNAAPDAHVTGETAAGVERTINHTFSPLLVGADAFQIESLWRRLAEAAPGQPAALAAVDIALHDLLGKAARLPLHRLLGGARAGRLTFITLSIEATAPAVARAREFQARGFRALKIKCGLDVEADIERVRAIRAAVGPAMRISLDANQGYDAAQSLHAIESLRDCDLAFIEQPVPARDLDALREVCARSPIPVMADESVLDARDVLRTPAPLVNLKLMKSGGVTGVRAANAVAEARGIRTMIGCMDESRISMAAAAQVALALDNVAFADLDGHLDILEDVASDGLYIVDGTVLVGDGDGLGVQMVL